MWFLGQVWYLIVSFPDLCLLSYFFLVILDPSSTEAYGNWVFCEHYFSYSFTHILFSTLQVPFSGCEDVDVI